MTIDRTPGKGKQVHNMSTHAAVLREGQFPALERENRPAVDTAAAAYYLSRRPQTLRCWATYDNGPLRPLRVNGRLAWPTAEIRRLLGVA